VFQIFQFVGCAHFVQLNKELNAKISDDTPGSYLRPFICDNCKIPAFTVYNFTARLSLLLGHI